MHRSHQDSLFNTLNNTLQMTRLSLSESSGVTNLPQRRILETVLEFGRFIAPVSDKVLSVSI